MLPVKYISASFLLLLIISCDKDHLSDCLKSTGSVVSEVRSVSDFNRLDVYNNVNVIITQDSINSIAVEAGKHIIYGITTEINDGVLVIRNENKCNWVRSYATTIEVHLHVKDLSIIHHYGSAKISSTNTLSGSTLDINVWSAGDIALSVEAGYIYSRQHSTVGDMTLSGHTTSLYIYNNGNAFTYEKELQVLDAAIEQHGTGDIYVTVNRTMSVSIHDSGNVYYSGNPQVTSSVTGSGRLIH